MTETITGYITSTVTLHTGTLGVSVLGTVDAYGAAGTYKVFGALESFDAAIFGPAVADFTITNDGTIFTAPPIVTFPVYDYGVLLGEAGRIVNAGYIGGPGGIGILANGSSYLDNTGTIEGNYYGVTVFAGRLTAANAGMIKGLDDGLKLLGGGAVSNAAGGMIEGVYRYGVYADQFLTVSNAGTILSPYDAGIYLRNGGAVSNAAGGTISGAAYGVVIRGGVGSVSNAGVIAAGAGDAVYLAKGGTVSNAGVMYGAVVFAGGTGDLLQLAAGAAPSGGAHAVAGSGSRIELGAGVGTLAGFGTDVTGFGSVTLDPGAAWVLEGDAAGLSGVSISGFGPSDTLVLDGFAGVSGSYSTKAGLVLSDGAAAVTIGLHGGFSTADFLVTSDGTNTTIGIGGALSLAAGQNEAVLGGFDVANPEIAGGTLVLNAGASVSGGLSFAGAGELVFAPAANGSLILPAVEIAGFTAGDTIELGGVSFAANADSYTVAADGTLSIDAGGQMFELLIAGATIGQDDFVLSGDLAVTEVNCFCAGTRIRSAHGETPVEDLAIGDLLPTLHAGLQPIKWIGQRRYGGRFIAGNKRALPVCIKASALGLGVPSRDLLVSPGHAICLGGGLIHAGDLVNGISVVQLSRVEDVHYFHIELATHEVIFAEDCPAESFMGEVFRAQFQNYAAYAALYPNEAAPAHGCLTRPAQSVWRTAMWERVARRAGVGVGERKRLLF